MIHIKRIDEFASYGVNEMAVKGSALANYDEIDIFDSKYFLVKEWIDGYKRYQYNLADRNGNLISEIWFDKIEKNDDGSIVVNKDNEREKDVTYSSVGELVKNVEIMDAAIDAVLAVQDISLTDTYPLTPYQITDKNTNTKKTIIARATLDDKEVFVGDDGKLYNADGSEYKIEFDYDEIENELESYIIEELFDDTDYDNSGIWLPDTRSIDLKNNPNGFVALQTGASKYDDRRFITCSLMINMDAFTRIYCGNTNAQQESELKQYIGIDKNKKYDYLKNLKKFEHWLRSNLYLQYDLAEYFPFEIHPYSEWYGISIDFNETLSLKYFINTNKVKGSTAIDVEKIKKSYASIVNEILKVIDKKLCQSILNTQL